MSETPMQAPTPLTDALLDNQHGGIWRSMEVHGHQMSVPASFARQLERELRAAVLRAGELEYSRQDCNPCEDTMTETTLVSGKSYRNGRGDLLGPMDERVPGVFLDQFGRLYKPDGRQWDHVVGSTGNIVEAA